MYGGLGLMSGGMAPGSLNPWGPMGQFGTGTGMPGLVPPQYPMNPLPDPTSVAQAVPPAGPAQLSTQGLGFGAAPPPVPGAGQPDGVISEPQQNPAPPMPDPNMGIPPVGNPDPFSPVPVPQTADASGVPPPGAPLDISAQGPGGPGRGMMGAPSQMGQNNPMLQAMRGMVAPNVPAPQKITTPHVTAGRNFNPGGFASLMQQLGVGVPRGAPYNLPSTMNRGIRGV